MIPLASLEAGIPRLVALLDAAKERLLDKPFIP
jgi:hypothetical protein